MNAQATFKNMLGGLGNISDQMAYALSEGITQMAVDYASLYNQTFEQAFTKFQAALAGQVRPIRSVSGFDITEQTLFSLYQELGGEKTMRQLNRTEKQLLSILAIFQQMSATGAVGDLNKTMESFANQSRVMAESWKQVQSYAGILVTYTIQESGLLTYVNAILIFIGDTLKAVAESLGAIQHFADPFQATTEGALGAREAIDEVQGKLLDFDKFRSLSGAEENALGLDERLLQAFSNFDSILANANMEAQNLANTWKIASGLFDESGVFNKERWDEIISSVSTFAKVVGVLIGLKLAKWIGGFVSGLFAIGNASKIVNAVILTGVVYAIVKAIEFFQKGDYWGGIFATTIGVVLAGAFIFLHKQGIAGVITGLGKFMSTILVTNTLALGSAKGAIFALTMSFIGLGSAIVGAFAIMSSWSDMNTWQRIIGIIGVATTAILGLAMAFGAFHSAWSLGLASAGIVAGIGMIVASIATIKKDIPNVANDSISLPDTSIVSNASNMGANINYTPTNTTSTMSTANMKNAMYQALVEYGNSHSGGNEPIVIKIGEEEVFRATRKSAKRQGLDFVKV